MNILYIGLLLALIGFIAYDVRHYRKHGEGYISPPQSKAANKYQGRK